MYWFHKVTMPSKAYKIRDNTIEKLNEYPGEYVSDKIDNLILIKTAVPIETVKRALKEVIIENGLVISS